MPSSNYQDVISLTVNLPTRRCPRVFMNISMWGISCSFKVCVFFMPSTCAAFLWQEHTLKNCQYDINLHLYAVQTYGMCLNSNEKYIIHWNTWPKIWKEFIPRKQMKNIMIFNVCIIWVVSSVQMIILNHSLTELNIHHHWQLDVQDFPPFRKSY